MTEFPPPLPPAEGRVSFHHAPSPTHEAPGVPPFAPLGRVISSQWAPALPSLVCMALNATSLSPATWSFMRAIKGHTTTVKPPVTRAVCW